MAMIGLVGGIIGTVVITVGFIAFVVGLVRTLPTIVTGG